MARQNASAFVLTGAALGVNLLSGAVVARALGASGRGELAAVIAAMSVIAWLWAMGARQAITYHQARSPQDAPRLLATWLILAVPLAGGGIALGELVLPQLLAAQSDAALNAARLFMLMVLGFLLGEILYAVLLGDHEFVFVNAMRLAQPAGITIGYLVLWGSGHLSVTTALIAMVVVISLDLLVVATRVLRRHGLARPDPALARQTLWYGLRAHGSSTAGLVNTRLDLMIIPAFLAASSVGHYAVATSISWIVLTVAAALGDLALPAAARHAERAVETIVHSLHATLAVGTCIALGIGAAADVGIRLVYGAEFAGAALPLRILLPGCVLLAAGGVLRAGLYALNRPLAAGMTQLAGMAVTVVGLLLFLREGGIAAAAIVTTASYGVSFVSALVVYRAAAGVSWRRFLPPAARPRRWLRPLAGAAWKPARYIGPRRMRIGIVAHGIHDDGGQERAVAELVRRLHHEYDLVVFASELDPNLRTLVTWKRVPTPRRPAPVRFVVFYLLASARVAACRLDVVHAVGAVLPQRLGMVSIPCLHTAFRERTRGCRNGAPPLRRVNAALALLLWVLAERWSFRPGRVRLVAPTSAGAASELERHYPGVRIHVIPNAVDTSRFRPDGRVRAEVRSAFGARDDRVLGLFLGGDWYHKGLPIALEALALAVGTVGDTAGELWVVGSGDSRRMAYFARQLGIEERVRFLGFRRDTERFYQAADVFLLPTAYESFSIATHEAAACGLPLLVPRVNGVAELIDAGGGLVVQREPTSIAAALCRLAKDPDLRAELGRAARRRAEQFSWERAASEVAWSYREVTEVA